MKSFLLICFLAAILLTCEDPSPTIIPEDLTYRNDMRTFVQEISLYAKTRDTSFIVIPQNGQELVTLNGDPAGERAADYLKAIDGVGREDLFFGYDTDNRATDPEDTNYLLQYLEICQERKIRVLATDYCHTTSRMEDSYRLNADHGFLSFAAPDRELNLIPTYPVTPYRINKHDISHLDSARNFLYLINPGDYSNKSSFLNSLRKTDYDVIIMDYFFDDTEEYTLQEIQSLKTKQNGGKRLVIAYMSIGEAEDYRYYWKSDWKQSPPAWLAEENPKWKGNYKVKYWQSGWKEIIMGGSNAYLDKIISREFDGVYLDIIDAFEYFED